MRWWIVFRQPTSLKVDDWFTNLADYVSETCGRWPATVTFVFFVLVWALCGPAANYSDSWQLWINTPTTIVGTLFSFFMLAAANRIEKRNFELHQHMAKVLEHVERLVEATEREERQELRELREIKAELVSWTRGK